MGEPTTRTNGYAPIADYAAIGDGRMVALVARDGAIDWLGLPDTDSPTVFGALLDAKRGGSFSLAPVDPYDVTRRYVPGTNVLETTFTTTSGTVRVTDALTLPSTGFSPLRELVRRIDGLRGSVRIRWRVEPRFGYRHLPRMDTRDGIPVATSGAQAVAVRSWGGDGPVVGPDAVHGEMEVTAGRRATLAASFADQEPLVLPSRQEAEARLDATVGAWGRWTERRTYDGPWREAVERSVLALRLLVFAPSGAVAAAATTSLPEALGGERNWDYRYCWIRDAAFTMDALLTLGCSAEAEAFFWWLMHASQLTRPRLRVLYRLDGGAHVPERELPLEGYRGSRPVRIGNAAAEQRQLDIYGHLLQTAWLYAESRGELDRDIARRLAEIADLVCDVWHVPDAGIWEVRSEPRHHTESKMLCWVALDRAGRLAERGMIPGNHAERWAHAADAIREFIETGCWSERLGSYTQATEAEALDASLLVGVLFDYGGGSSDRLRSTVDAVRGDLAEGPFVHRYRGDDGLRGREGTFVACSFWLVEALARTGRRVEAAELMEDVLALGNDVGLFAEELDPPTGGFLGNFPQALSHLALIGAASHFGEPSP